MPLKLVPPRKGKTPYYYVRGTYLGICVDRSTQTPEERAAKVIFKRWKSEIERGEYRHRAPTPGPVNAKQRSLRRRSPTFRPVASAPTSARLSK